MIDAVRKHRRKQSAVDLEKSSARIEAWLEADDTLPGVRAERQERLELFAEGLAGSSENRRMAVELKYMHAVSVREIAQRMELQEAAVGGLLLHGVRQLRERLGANLGDCLGNIDS